MADPSLLGYIFLPFITLTSIPLIAFVVTLTLNSFAAFLVYRGLRPLIGLRPALIGSALFATNPWIIEASRRTWLPALMPFFVSLVFWALVPVLTGQAGHPRRRILIATLGVAIFAHTTLLAYIIVVSVGVLLVRYRYRIPWRAFSLGLGVFVVLFSLYGLGLAREWDETRDGITSFLNDEFSLRDDALKHAVRLVTGWGYAESRGMDAPTDDAGLRAGINDILHWGWTVLLVFGVAKAGYSLLRGQRDGLSIAPHTATILLIWFLMPILVMSYVPHDLDPMHLLFTVPAGHGLVAWSLAPLAAAQGEDSPQWQRLGVWGLTGALMLTILVNGTNTVRFAQETAASPGAKVPGTLRLADAQALGAQIGNAYQEGRVIYTPGDERTTIAMAGQIFPAEQAMYLGSATVIPREGGLYVTFAGPGMPLNPVPHARVVDLPLRLADGTRISLWRAAQDFAPVNAADVPSDSGIRFLGWWELDRLRAGTTSVVRTYWRVDRLHPERTHWDFMPYLHVYDQEGQRRATGHGEKIPTTHWREGAWLVYDIPVDVPEEIDGPLELRTGFYDATRMVDAVFSYPAGGAENEMIFTTDLVLIGSGAIQ
ncbi:MAG: hypothetical protein GYB66_12985 [Chloroflexi bacterium]|nr:hypothetical protein [Chloroflexota bacterium]